MKQTAKFYATHPASRNKHRSYQKEYNKTPAHEAKRVELTKANRKRGGYHDGMDLAHTSKGLVKKTPSANRGSKSDMPSDRKARGSK